LLEFREVEKQFRTAKNNKYSTLLKEKEKLIMIQPLLYVKKMKGRV